MLLKIKKRGATLTPFRGMTIINYLRHSRRGFVAMGLAVVAIHGCIWSSAYSQDEPNGRGGGAAPAPTLPGGRAGQAGAVTPPPPVANIDYEARLIEMYGAVLMAGGGVILPPRILFADEAAVTTWQAGVPTEKSKLGNIEIELQTPALQALLAAREELKKIKLNLTPASRDAARRRYADTERLWKRRVEAGLYHWYKKRKLSRQDLRRIRALVQPDQTVEILRLESEGLFFSTNLKKTILASAAPPGASQHLSMLALDVKEHEKTKVRAALARHGWFQTVAGDFTHFTYLGWREEELPGLGLKRITVEKRAYWVPDRAANQ